MIDCFAISWNWTQPVIKTSFLCWLLEDYKRRKKFENTEEKNWSKKSMDFLWTWKIQHSKHSASDKVECAPTTFEIIHFDTYSLCVSQHTNSALVFTPIRKKMYNYKNNRNMNRAIEQQQQKLMIIVCFWIIRAEANT